MTKDEKIGALLDLLDRRSGLAAQRIITDSDKPPQQIIWEEMSKVMEEGMLVLIVTDENEENLQ